MLSKCCWLIPLREGTIIIGALGIAFNIAASLIYLSMLCGWLYKGIHVFETQYTSMMTSTALLMLFSICSIAVCCIMIVGVLKRKLMLLIPWLILNGCACILTLVSLLLCLFERDIVMACINLTALVIQIYCLLIVYSYYKHNRNLAN